MQKKIYFNRLTKRENQIPEAIEGAFVVVLGQNALMLSKPLTEIGKGEPFIFFRFVIISIALITFFNIAANWLSIRKVDYTHQHLFWDIITLALFFIFTQLINDIYEHNTDLGLRYILMITSASYLLLGVLYVVWNNIEIGNLRERTNSHLRIDKLETKRLINANKWNVLSVPISIALGFSARLFGVNIITIAIFCSWFGLWITMMIIYIKGYKL